MPAESDAESYFSDASQSFDECDGCGIFSGKIRKNLRFSGQIREYYGTKNESLIYTACAYNNRFLEKKL